MAAIAAESLGAMKRRAGAVARAGAAGALRAAEPQVPARGREGQAARRRARAPRRRARRDRHRRSCCAFGALQVRRGAHHPRRARRLPRCTSRPRSSRCATSPSTPAGSPRPRRRASACSTCSTASPRSATGRARAPAPRCRGDVRLRGRRASPTSPGHRGAASASTSTCPAGRRAWRIVGPSGAGKSTLVALLPRLYDPDRRAGPARRPRPARPHARVAAHADRRRPAGERAVRRHRAREHRLRRARTPTDEEVVAAARLADAHDFITRAARAATTPCSASAGRRCRAAQRQRIAIARAAVRDARDRRARRADHRPGRGATSALVTRALEAAGRRAHDVPHRPRAAHRRATPT